MWKTVRASEKCSSTTSIDVNISHQMAPLRMLYIVILTYIFKFKKVLEIYNYLYTHTTHTDTISGKRWQLTKNALVRLL